MQPGITVGISARTCVLALSQFSVLGDVNRSGISSIRQEKTTMNETSFSYPSMQWRDGRCPICHLKVKVRGLPYAASDIKSVRCKRCLEYDIDGQLMKKLDDGSFRFQDGSVFHENRHTLSGALRNFDRSKEDDRPIVIHIDTIEELISFVPLNLDFFSKLDLILIHIQRSANSDADYVRFDPLYDCSLIYGTPNELSNLLKKGCKMEFIEPIAEEELQFKLDVKGHKRLRELYSDSDVAQQNTSQSITDEWDVFICHAGEDNQEVATPLAERLRDSGLKVWFDQFELTLGDSLRRKIDQGLAKLKYGVVILSPNFFRKNWPQYELDGLVQRDISRGKVLLPVWHNVSDENVRQYSPTLADKLAVSTANGLEVVVSEILKVFR